MRGVRASLCRAHRRALETPHLPTGPTAIPPADEDAGDRNRRDQEQAEDGRESEHVETSVDRAWRRHHSNKAHGPKAARDRRAAAQAGSEGGADSCRHSRR